MLEAASVQGKAKQQMLYDLVKMKSRYEERLDIQERVKKDLEAVSGGWSAQTLVQVSIRNLRTRVLFFKVCRGAHNLQCDVAYFFVIAHQPLQRPHL